MKKTQSLFILLLISTWMSFGQRAMENLDRGLVALQVQEGVYLSWRITAPEWYGTSYHVYRNGQRISDSPLAGASNFIDTGGNAQATYSISALKDGVEGSPSKPVAVLTRNYLSIPLRELGVEGYEANDVTVADLDGDGEMEILLKRLYPDWSPAARHFSYIEAYKLDGTFMWSIDVGPNIISDVENNVAAFDLDGDGKAEVFMRTSEGTIFGDGVQIGDTDKDGITNYRSYSWAGTDGNYPNHSTYLCKGPEFLSLIDGETGKELDRVDYIPRTFGGKTMEQIWGDSYGHRANKFFFGAPYLDGKKPSIFISRGIYTRIVMRTYDVVDKKLVFKWEFNTDDNPSYAAQGNHNYTIADVDNDGCDEIVYGSMTVDHDGKGLYSTELGHGDAMHVSDFDPYRKGLEVFACHEHFPYGTSFRDAATGEILIRHTTAGDCGRCNAANVSNRYPGAELWGGGKMFSASTRQETPGATSGGSENFALYWDGDLLQETFNYVSTSNLEGNIRKFDGNLNLLTTSGAATCNGTKGTPCMQVDLFGDWREEIIMRSADNKELRVYISTIPTNHRIYTLLHDMQYRQAICWQMCGYNQPPHVSFFLGESEGITLPPPPVASNDKLVYDGAWTAWLKNGNPVAYQELEELLFDRNEGGVVSLPGAVNARTLTVNSQGTYALEGGELSGSMRLNKQGAGELRLNCAASYTGPTELWDGLTTVHTVVSQSPVWMNRFAELNLHAALQKGLVQEYGSVLRIGNDGEKAVATVADSLWLKWGAQINWDIYDSDLSSDLLLVNGKLILTEGAVFQVIPHASDGKQIKAGKYILAEVTGGIAGDVSSVKVSGLEGISHSLSIEDGKIALTVNALREASSVVWSGLYNGGRWNLAEDKNFLLDGEEAVFVTGDRVTLNDEASVKQVEITMDVAPAEVLIHSSADYTFLGAGQLTGPASLTKKGSGTLTIANAHSFTGKVRIEEGTVVVSSLANSLNKTGALGSVHTGPDDFVLNGASLKTVTKPVVSDDAILIGEDGATINTTSDLTLKGLVAGGVLEKTGNGTLYLEAGNTLEAIVVNGGTLNLATENSILSGPGKKIVLNSGTVHCLNDINTYSRANWHLEVPEGKAGTLNLDGRCDYYTVLTGGGSLNLFTPFVRSDIYGNWNAFTGTIQVTTDSDGGDLRVRGNNGGFANAHVSVAEKVNVYNESKYSLAFGALTGKGTLTGNHPWVFGDRTAAYTFEGSIAAGSVTKKGNSSMSLPSPNTYTGGTSVQGGELILTNTSGSATGSGAVEVADGGTLILRNMKATGMGAINVRGGGVLYARNSSTNSAVSLDNNACLYIGDEILKRSSFTAPSVLARSGSKICFDIQSASLYDKMTLSSDLNCMEGAIISVSFLNDTYRPLATDTFQLVSTRISGSPSYDLPELPADYAWDTSQLEKNGKLCVQEGTLSLDLLQGDSGVRYSIEGSMLCVKFSDAKACRLRIVNTQGMELIAFDSRGNEKEYLSLDKLPQGLYLLLVSSEKGVYSFKFVRE